MTVGQSLDVAVRSRPRYAKDVVFYRVCPFALDSIAATACASYSSRRCHVCSVPRAQMLVVGWRRSSATQGTNMS